MKTDRTQSPEDIAAQKKKKKKHKSKKKNGGEKAFSSSFHIHRKVRGQRADQVSVVPQWPTS